MGLAQTVEVFFSQQGLRSALDVAADRRGRWFEPELVDALFTLQEDTEFWRMVCQPNPLEHVSKFEPPDIIINAHE